MVLQFSTSHEEADVSNNSEESFEILLGPSGVANDCVVTDVGDDAATSPVSNTKTGSARRRQQQLRPVTDNEDTDDEEEEDLFAESELTWRSHPTMSLSDWTIEITVRSTKVAQKYHVHKSILAVGPKRSNYFAKTFLHASDKLRKRQIQSMQLPHRSNNVDPCDFLLESTSFGTPNNQVIDYVDHDTCTSRIELDQLAAQAMPVLLDFVYRPTSELDITTDNATALHSLSGQFEMKLLRRKVKEFWTRDLCMANLVTYYDHARIFKDLKIITHAETFCANHIFEIPEMDVVDILTAVDPYFFLKVVSICGDLHRQTSTTKSEESATTIPVDKESPQTLQEKGSLRLSLLIAVFGNIHKNEFNPTLFNQLTSEKHLPVLETKAAKVLLELEYQVCGSEVASKMTPLKDRAIRVLSENWQESCFESPHEEEDSMEDCGDDSDKRTESTETHLGPLVLDLPQLEGDALIRFVGDVLLHAKQGNIQLLQDLKELRSWKEQCEASASLEEFLRKDLKDTKDLLEQTKKTFERDQQELTTRLENQIQTLQKEKEELISKNDKEVKQLTQIRHLEVEVLKEQFEKDMIDYNAELTSYRTKTLKLTSEISEYRKEAALKRDKLKLARVAAEGPSGALKTSQQ